MRNYDERTVVRELSRNAAISIDSVSKSKVISVIRNAKTIGNGSWGKIDFLTKYCGYFVSVVDNDKRLAKKLEDAEAKRIAKKAAIAEKRKGKIDIVGAVKHNLGKVKFNGK